MRRSICLTISPFNSLPECCCLFLSFRWPSVERFKLSMSVHVFLCIVPSFWIAWPLIVGVLSIHLFTHPFIHLYVYSSIHMFIHPSIHPSSTHPAYYPPTRPSIPCIYPCIQSCDRFTDADADLKHITFHVYIFFFHINTFTF